MVKAVLPSWLVVGDEDGRVALVENVSPANASTPVFHQPVYFRQQADELKFGALSTPYAHDWDGDGDAVLFSDEAERVFKAEGLDAFTASERAAARTPLSGGPFKPFLAA